MLQRAEGRQPSREAGDARAGPQGRLFDLKDPQTVALLAVAAFACIGFALRWIASQQSLFGDELSAFTEVTFVPLSTLIDTISANAGSSPPLFFLIAWATVKLGDPATLIRLPSAVAGVATVPVIYLLGQMIAGRRCGMIAAALYAVMPFAIYYGSEARPYALLVLLVSLSTLMLLKALATRGQRRWWVAYWLICILAFATHYTAAIAVGLQALWALVTQRDRWREILVVQAATFLPFLPLLPKLVHASRGVIEPLGLTLEHILEAPVRLLLGHPYATFQQVPGTASIALWWLAGGLVVAAIVAPHLRRSGLPLRSWSAGGTARIPHVGWLLVALTAGTFAVTLTYSEVAPRSIYSARHLNTMLPYLCVIVGALAAMLRTRLALVATGAIISGALLGSVRELADFPRPDLHAAAEAIEDQAPPFTPVAEAYRFGSNHQDPRRDPLQVGLSIYLDGRYPISNPRDPSEWPRGSQVFLVDGGFLLRGAQEAIAQAAGARPLGIQTFDGFQTIYVTRYSRVGRPTSASQRAIGVYLTQHPDEVRAYLDSHPEAKRRFKKESRSRLGSGQ
jgi:hypothetical protein